MNEKVERKKSLHFCLKTIHTPVYPLCLTFSSLPLPLPFSYPSSLLLLTFPGMNRDCPELRSLLSSLAARIDATSGKLDSQEIGNAL